MGDRIELFHPSFNGSIHVGCEPQLITSDAGAIPLREIDDRLQLVPWLTERLWDPRDPERIIHPLPELLRTRLYLLAQGRKDQDDSDTYREDAAYRLGVSGRRGQAPLRPSPRDDNGAVLEPEGLASQPTMSRLVSALSLDENRQVLHQGVAESAIRRILATNGGRKLPILAIDIDSIPIDVYGHQPEAEYNGYYHRKVYHPLIVSIGETGDWLGAKLRHGKAHTAEGDLEFVLPILDEVEKRLCKRVFVRVDAGFPDEPFLSGLEHRHTHYVGRLTNNAVLDRMAKPYLSFPPGPRPKRPRTWFYEMMYRAEPWSRARRVVLVVQEVPGQLWPNHFWLVTSWTKYTRDAQTVLEIYRQRGTAEGHQGEFKDVLDPALSSACRPKTTYRGRPPRRRTPSIDAFAHNEVLLLLNALAYNLAHAGRVLVEESTGDGWSLRRFQERVLKVGGVFTLHARAVKFNIAPIACALWKGLWAGLRGFQFAVG